MFRFRRYRVFLVVASLLVLALYHFTSLRVWGATSGIAADFGRGGQESISSKIEAIAKSAKLPGFGNEDDTIEQPESQPSPLPPPAPPPALAPETSPKAAPTERPRQTAAGAPKTSVAPLPASAAEPSEAPAANNGRLPYQQPLAALVDDLVPDQGRVEIEPIATAVAMIHWMPQPEHFPVPSGSTIQLPTGTPKPIPQIQHVFDKPESAADKADRLEKLDIIKNTFLHAWQSYKEFAWRHDELMPISGGFKDPFAGWGATLVDTLDTLWMMGLEDEFDEAVKAVGLIDFTTTLRNDIPLFETVIRYLGGLLGAYDVSGGKYRTLLDKAAELAEVLMGAFDTPNRMPLTYYLWKPAYVSQPHRAKARVVLAEIGSLSLEFTRLAQLTGEPKYYDAISRITDALEEWQMQTKLPGLWPVNVDASGCAQPERINNAVNQALAATSPLGKPRPAAAANAEANAHGFASGAGDAWTPSVDDLRTSKISQPLSKAHEVEQALAAARPRPGSPMPESAVKALEEAEAYASKLAAEESSAIKPAKKDLDSALVEELKRVGDRASPVNSLEFDDGCLPQGLTSPTKNGMEEFTLGAQADSTYEYLPKEYIMLGGRKEQYRSMYEKAMQAAKEHLLFRPMIEDEADILLMGSKKSNGMGTANKFQGFEAHLEHLNCFTGGMFALGAKIFNRPDDLEIAEKLAEGCVWAYNVTTTGIMPESSRVLYCEDMTDCAWNETKWFEALDPFFASRNRGPTTAPGGTKVLSVIPSQSPPYSDRMTQKDALEEHGDLVQGARMSSSQTQAAARPATGIKAKRQLTEIDRLEPLEEMPERSTSAIRAAKPTSLASPTSPTSLSAATAEPFILPQPPTHEEYVASRIHDERLPPGFTKIVDKRYILRPEAIESVFYLHRITGSPHWRAAGWRMFRAIEAATWTAHGHAAIRDVTARAPQLDDSMESFWLAETLKYFWLLFCEEGAWSLDEWVFNTEAHPFRRTS